MTGVPLIEARLCRLCAKRKPANEFCQHAANGAVVVESRCLQCRRAYYRTRAATGYHRRYEQTRRDRVLRRLRAAANRVAAEAIASGQLHPAPCVCLDETCRGKVKPHHEDYSQPLEVVWLCESHHQRRHAQLRRMALQHLAQLGLFVADGAAAPARKWQPKGPRFVRRRGAAPERSR